MRDFVIKVKHQKTELLVFALCVLIAWLLNALAIKLYNTQWEELYTQWQVVILLCFFLYMLSWIIRLIYLGIKTIWLTLVKRK